MNRVRPKKRRQEKREEERGKEREGETRWKRACLLITHPERRALLPSLFPSLPPVSLSPRLNSKRIKI